MIQNFNDLQKLFKICRKQGISDIEIGGVIKIKFGELPPNEHKDDEPEQDANPYAGFPPGELTEEQLMFYSSGGLPSEDPSLQGS